LVRLNNQIKKFRFADATFSVVILKMEGEVACIALCYVAFSVAHLEYILHNAKK